MMTLAIFNDKHATPVQRSLYQVEQDRLMCRLITVFIGQLQRLVIDHITKGGNFVRSTYDTNGKLVERTYYRSYDHINKKPLHPHHLNLFG